MGRSVADRKLKQRQLESIRRSCMERAKAYTLTHPGVAAHNLAILSWQSVLVSVGIHEPKLFHPPPRLYGDVSDGSEECERQERHQRPGKWSVKT